MTPPPSTPMRLRLRANSNGKLTSEQWLDLVGAPVLPMLALIVPFLLLFYVPPVARVLRLLTLTRFALPAVILGAVLLLVLLRARHYARQPVLHTTLYADAPTRRGATMLTTEDGTPVTFRTRLAPNDPMTPNTAYTVYHLDEPAGKTLLSYIPLRHADAPTYAPTVRAQARVRRHI